VRDFRDRKELLRRGQIHRVEKDRFRAEKTLFSRFEHLYEQVLDDGTGILYRFGG
jgi:hypothetical protein